MKSDSAVVKRNVSMYPNDWGIVEEVNTHYGLNNISATLRFIVNEYYKTHKRVVEEDSNGPSA